MAGPSSLSSEKMFAFAAASAPSITHPTTHGDIASAGAQPSSAQLSSPALSLHTLNTQRHRAPSAFDEAEDVEAKGVDSDQWTEENLLGLKNKELQDILESL